MKAGEILRAAAEAVEGPRDATHGDKAATFAEIAWQWNEHLRVKMRIPSSNPVQLIDGADVAEMMSRVKYVREMLGEPIADHYLDRCGYDAIRGQLKLRG